jgi:putative transposase
MVSWVNETTYGRWRPPRTVPSGSERSAALARHLLPLIIDLQSTAPTEAILNLIIHDLLPERILATDQEGLVTPIGACGLACGSLPKGMKKISYAGYRFPPEIIHQAIWLYVRFTLSFRDVEDLLAERGIMVSYETVRRWVNHFGPMIAANLRKRRPKPYTTWHLDEVYLKIDGRMVYLWRAVDAEGEALDVLVQAKRNKRAALKLMRKLLKKYGFVPDKLVTDDLRSYAAAAGHLGIATRHERGQWRNNRPDDENARCRVSRVRVQPKNFSQPTQPPTTLSTSNAISPQQERTEPFARRQCARGAKSSLRHEPNMPADLLRALFGNVMVWTATTVLPDEILACAPYSPIPTLFTGEYRTFKEIWYKEKNGVGYLFFEFYNGAMSTLQCKRLEAAIYEARQRPTKILVFMGGVNFWSNGFHLNVIEAAPDSALESWNNINAIDDVVLAKRTVSQSAHDCAC